MVRLRKIGPFCLVGFESRYCHDIVFRRKQSLRRVDLKTFFILIYIFFLFRGIIKNNIQQDFSCFEWDVARFNMLAEKRSPPSPRLLPIHPIVLLEDYRVESSTRTWEGEKERAIRKAKKEVFGAQVLPKGELGLGWSRDHLTFTFFFGIFLIFSKTVNLYIYWLFGKN